MNRLLAKTEPDPDPLLPEEPTDGRGPSHLTASQAAALSKLSGMAELACHPVRYAGIAVRAVPLLLGRSGVGKTAVVSRLADHLGTSGNPLPMMHLTGPGWVIFQAKAEPATLTVLLAFIRRHGPRPGKPHVKGPAGLIFVDELDKSVAPGDKGTDAYSLAITGELLALIDKDDRLLCAGWSKQDIALLQAFMIVGAGAWQRVADRAATEGVSHLDLVEEDPLIPVEIARRFSTMIEITPPTQVDFVRVLSRLYDALGLPDPSESLVEVVAEAAAASGKGMRWVEAHLLDLLAKYPALRQPVPAPALIREERPTVLPAVIEAAFKDAYDQMSAVEPMLAYLATQVRLHADHIDSSEDFFPPGPSKVVDLLEKISLLQVGLRIRYARSVKGRELDSQSLWKYGHAVCGFVSQGLENDLAYLQTHKLIGLYTQIQVRLSRIMSAWEYVCSIDPVVRP